MLEYCYNAKDPQWSLQKEMEWPKELWLDHIAALLLRIEIILLVLPVFVTERISTVNQRIKN